MPSPFEEALVRRLESSSEPKRDGRAAPWLVFVSGALVATAVLTTFAAANAKKSPPGRQE